MNKVIFLFLFPLFLFANSPSNPMGLQGYIDSGISNYKKSEKKEKVSYRDLMAFLKASNDKNKIMILGILYSEDSSEPDDYGEYIKADIALASKYLLESYNMGNPKALAILGGLIFYNNNMAKLDRNLIKAEKYLKKSYNEGVFDAGLILANVQLVKGDYSSGVQTLLDISNRGDSSAQLQLALIFQKGIFSQNLKKTVIVKDRNLAEYYLNMACNNSKKSEKVQTFCYSDLVEINK